MDYKLAAERWHVSASTRHGCEAAKIGERADLSVVSYMGQTDA